MSKNLKIYACSGVGTTNSAYSYWLDNTQSVRNTQAVNGLLAKINLLYSEVQYLNLSEDETLDKLDQIDMYSVCVTMVRQFQDNSEELFRVGQVIGAMVADGDFKCDYLEDAQRDRNLDDLISKAYNMMNNDVAGDSEFMSWWVSEVMDRNSIGLSEVQQNSAIESLHSGTVSGSEQQADLVAYLNDASESVLYRYFSNDQLERLPYVFRRKKKVQDNLYQYWKPVYDQILGDGKMDDVIVSGIIKNFGARPEKLCQDIVAKYEKQQEAVSAEPGTAVMIGVLTVAEFISLLGTVLTFVAGVVTAICTTVGTIRVAEVQSVDVKAATGGIPSPDDYDGLEYDKDKKSDKSLYLIGAAALAAILLLRK